MNSWFLVENVALQLGPSMMSWSIHKFIGQEKGDVSTKIFTSARTIVQVQFGPSMMSWSIRPLLIAQLNNENWHILLPNRIVTQYQCGLLWVCHFTSLLTNRYETPPIMND